MSIRFVLGRAGSGKTSFAMDEVRKSLRQDPMGDPIIFLVPDQMTFQTEYELTTTPDLGGMIRAQVFHFSRLAWRVLQETGGISRYHISSLGVNMLIRKVIEHRKQELKVFEKTSEQSGFVDQIEQMITELKRYRISPEELKQKQEELGATPDKNAAGEVLADKLHDIHIIYDELEKLLLNRYVDSEDYLRLLAEKIAESDMIAKADIYVDGFYSFTPQEQLVIETLAKHAKRVTFLLTLDRPYEHKPHELDLFRMTASTYLAIKQFAKDEGIAIEETVKLTEYPRFKERSSLAHLERHYDTRPTVQFEGEPAITMSAAVNRRAEVESIARMIIEMVRDRGYRYRDIAIQVRNMTDYHDLIDTIFSDYGIPYFADQKRSMLHHPLIELIRSSFDVIQGNWRYDPVFRCVKTDLLYPLNSDTTRMREAMDQLENYVLAYGIQGQRWKDGKRWKYRRYQSLEGLDIPQTDVEKRFEDRLNDWRDMVVEPLAAFEKAVKKAKTAIEKTTALYDYLRKLNIPKKIERLRDEAEQAGDVQGAREHDQVWRAVLELMDQMVEIMGDEKLSIELFINMMNTGMESMKFALVPPALDQVLVGSLDRSRYSNVKVSFLIGANDGVLPAKPKEDAAISEQERDLLLESGMQLAPGSRQQLLDENFLIYLALTSASDHLYISYPLADEEGKSLMPSVLIKRIDDLFPQLNKGLLLNDPGEVEEEEQLRFITNPRKTLSYLALQLQSLKRGYPIAPFWRDVYNYFHDEPKWSLQAERVLGSLFYQNQAKQLTNETSNELYGTKIQASVSRMERYNACAFSHFASHGLKLKERKVFRLEAPDIGQLFHAALKLITEQLIQQKLDWSMLTKAQVESLSMRAVDELAPKLQGEILLSSNRHHYIKRKLQQVVSRASLVLSEHAKASGFVPVGLELGFGADGPLPSLRFTLPNGVEMELVGRIDRVDKAESTNGMLLRIVDYKSSQTSLNLAEVYYGLALQMLTYLDVVITHAGLWLHQQAVPAGVLYFHVHNPLLNTKGRISLDQIEKELFKQFKMKGLVLADEEAVRLMDTVLDTGYSEILPVALKKDGGFYNNSSVASAQEFDLLRQHARQVMVETGTNITDGIIDINPYKLKNKIPCTFCSYKSVCQFDQSLETNEYRGLKPEKPADVLAKIRMEEGDSDDVEHS